MYKCSTNCNNCKKEHVRNFKLRDVFDKKRNDIASIDYDIKNFYIKCDKREPFIYMNLKRSFT